MTQNRTHILPPGAEELIKTRYQADCDWVHRMMTWIMIGQWVVGIALALFLSPLTWIGQYYSVHIHVWTSVLLGGSLSAFAISWMRMFPYHTSTRHVVAISQVLWSALLIHLSGGRIEAHFHVFASLAILSNYRDWKILASATVVVAIDHLVRGVFYPASVFGVFNESPFRWIEHAAWVLFEVAFLAPGCKRQMNELRELCIRQDEIEKAKKDVDEQVEERTSQLSVTNRLLTEKTAEAEKLALVAKHTDNGVIITDENAVVDWVNESYSKLSGFKTRMIVGRHITELLNGPSRTKEQVEKIQTAIDRCEGFNIELELKHRKGNLRWVSVEARPILNADGTLGSFIIIGTDITERVLSELENHRLHESLVEASRMAGMADVSAAVLHNVGNLLNSIGVSTGLISKWHQNSAFDRLLAIVKLVEEHEDDLAEFIRQDARGQNMAAFLNKVAQVMAKERESVRHEIKDLASNIEHVKKVVSVQQSMAKASGCSQKLKPADLIEDSITANKGRLVSHEVDVVVKLDEHLPSINSDKHKILQILINLIKNATDAMIDNRDARPRLQVSARSCGDRVEFSVQDNGVGIPTEQMDKIFHHGFTTKPTGHGFGLHSSANAASELGGSLLVESEGIGKGATFLLTLPIKNRDSITPPLETTVSSLQTTTNGHGYCPS